MDLKEGTVEMAIYLHEISHPYWRTESIIRGVAFCFPNENATVGTKMRLHLYCAMIMRDMARFA